MFIDIECVFDLHLDGSYVKPGEDPRAKREWLEAIQKANKDCLVQEIELSPNNNYQFRIYAPSEERLTEILTTWYFRDNPQEAHGYVKEFVNKEPV